VYYVRAFALLSNQTSNPDSVQLAVYVSDKVVFGGNTNATLVRA